MGQRKDSAGSTMHRVARACDMCSASKQRCNGKLPWYVSHMHTSGLCRVSASLTYSLLSTIALDVLVNKSFIARSPRDSLAYDPYYKVGETSVNMQSLC